MRLDTIDWGRAEQALGKEPCARPAVATLRATLYPPLAHIANRWAQALRSDQRFPDTLEAFRLHCAAGGQAEPTPLLLRYDAGGYNCLHQDVVAGGQGDLVVFPNRFRPVKGARGVLRGAVRHGLSRVPSGQRHALGIVIHDAR